jgi:hypothetical protein
MSPAANTAANNKKDKMPFLKWDESPHWSKPRLVLVDDRQQIIKEPALELPAALTARSRREIIDAIRDDPRYNATNPSNQQHIIDMAIESARLNGTLIEETQGELISG